MINAEVQAVERPILHNLMLIAILMIMNDNNNNIVGRLFEKLLVHPVRRDCAGPNISSGRIVRRRMIVAQDTRTEGNGIDVEEKIIYFFSRTNAFGVNFARGFYSISPLRSVINARVQFRTPILYFFTRVSFSWCTGPRNIIIIIITMVPLRG